jgi:hypothetical protein
MYVQNVEERYFLKYNDRTVKNVRAAGAYILHKLNKEFLSPRCGGCATEGGDD